MNPQLARKIASSTYKGVGETFSEKYKDDTLRRMFDFKGVFNRGLELMDELGMSKELASVHEMTPETIKENLQPIVRTFRRDDAENYKFHYKNWE